MKKLIIGIGGLKGHGKDTLANLMQAELIQHGISVRQQRLAAPLYRAAAILMGRDLSNLSREEKEGLQLIPGEPRSTPRNVLKTLGDEWGRQMISPDIWCSRMQKAYETMPDGYVMIVPDVRYQNELGYVITQGGLPVWVDASRRVPSDSDDHASENSVSAEDFNYVVPNGGGVESLAKRAKMLLTDFLVEWNNE